MVRPTNAPGGPRLAVLVSGRGSNLQAILDAAATGSLGCTPVLVVSNRPGAAALERARVAGVPTAVVDHRAYRDRAAFEMALGAVLDGADVTWVALAGFMRVLTADFVAQRAGRLVNIHPSLLPAWPGLDTHAQVLAAGERWHGASVHFVTAQVDGGPVIAQVRVPVLPGDTPDTLAARVLRGEHRLYPAVLAWLAAGRVAFRDGRVWMDGAPLGEPVRLADEPA
jgi:phosphoribosylglycinamide formyltransferase 1